MDHDPLKYIPREPKYLVTVLAFAVISTAVPTVGIWTGNTVLAAESLDPVVGLICGTFLFLAIVLTAQNALSFWICAICAAGFLEFAFWVLSQPVRLRDVLTIWIVIAAIAARVIQWRGFTPGGQDRRG